MRQNQELFYMFILLLYGFYEATLYNSISQGQDEKNTLLKVSVNKFWEMELYSAAAFL
jgi:hypothetical protein